MSRGRSILELDKTTKRFVRTMQCPCHCQLMGLNIQTSRDLMKFSASGCHSPAYHEARPRPSNDRRNKTVSVSHRLEGNGTWRLAYCRLHVPRLCDCMPYGSGSLLAKENQPNTSAVILSLEVYLGKCWAPSAMRWACACSDMFMYRYRNDRTSVGAKVINTGVAQLPHSEAVTVGTPGTATEMGTATAACAPPDVPPAVAALLRKRSFASSLVESSG